MNDIPRGWKKTSLEELMDDNSLFKDGEWVESKDQDAHGKNRLIQISDIGDGVFLDRTRRFLNDQQFIKLKCKELIYNDILIARLSEPLGRACLFPLTVSRCSTIVDVSILRAPLANVHWLLHVINSSLFRDQVKQYARGTTRPRILRKDIAKIPFLAPPRNEQNKIAESLESIQKVIEIGQAYIKKLRLIKQNMLEKMFLEHTNTILLEEILSPQKNAMRSGPFGSDLRKHDLKPTGIPYLGIDNIQHEKYINQYQRFVDEETFLKFQKYQVKSGDVIITIMGTIGRACVVPNHIGKALSSKHLWTMTFDTKRYIPDLICWQLNFAPWVLEQFQVQKQGGVLEAISSAILKKLVLPFPDMTSQKKIYEMYEQFNHAIYQKEQYIKKVSLLKDSLTNDLLTGALSVK
jgi:type I restriction enzyme S subunit